MTAPVPDVVGCAPSTGPINSVVPISIVGDHLDADPNQIITTLGGLDPQRSQRVAGRHPALDHRLPPNPILGPSALSITANNVQQTFPGVFTYTVLPPPVILALSPAAGPLAGVAPPSP